VEAELIVAREEADRANQGKSRFLATASHDLRQPLQTLALLNGALRRFDTDSECAEALAQQEQAIGAMSRLLNALLDISKLESGAIKPEPTDFKVASVFEELRADFASVAANKGLRLEVVSCQECAHSDPSLVEQILRNLVSNAVKYTRAGLDPAAVSA
jgi:signal transduction histidine kinase